MRYIVKLCTTLFFSLFFTTAVSAQHQTLVYTSLQPGKWHLFLFQGSIPNNITSGETLNYNPKFSPDGRWIVFTSEREGTAHLFSLDTQHLDAPAQRLTNSTHFEDQVTFSPDGKTLYFVSARDGSADIYSMPFKPGTVLDFNTTKNLTQRIGNNFRPAVSPNGRWIAFSSNRFHKAPNISNASPPKNYRAADIFMIRTDGTQLKRLTKIHQWDGSPVWSRDGKTIYFYSTRDKKAHIYAVNTDGKQLRMISPKPIPAVTPAVMLNGRVAFAGQFGGRWSIASVNADGSDLEYESDTRINYYGPAFNPKTGQLIAYGDGPTTKQPFINEPTGGVFGDTVYIDKPLGIGGFNINQYQVSLENQPIDLSVIRGYFANVVPNKNKVLSVKEFRKVVVSSINGDNMQTVFAPNDFIVGMSWSPDQRWLVAAVGVPFSPVNNKVDIWKVSLDGSKKQKLTKDLPGNNAFPRISADGKTIVFRSGTKGYKQIFSMHSDGTHIKQLTHSKEIDTMPAVSPDGKWVVFSSIHNGENYNLYLTDIEGKQAPQKLTNNRYADMHPIFSPDGKWIAFASERGGLLDEMPLIPVFCAQPYGDIYAIRLSDKKVVRLTETKWESSLPDWR